MTTDWRGRRVLITGHTGFMGGWLSSFLALKGAEVHGLALPPPTNPSFFDATGLENHIASSTLGDIRDEAAVRALMREISPEVVFHAAAQPLVRAAYNNPLDTFSTNMMGTAHVLQAACEAPSVRALLVVTTDKVYLNKNQAEPYREGDVLGGREPYSASKAASEFVVDAYRHSYLAARGVGVATLRAGNIIGGGDWATDRLVPDAMRSFSAGAPLVIRRPDATRPWQHVMDPVQGFLTLAERLLASPTDFSEGWNFGPAEDDCQPVARIAEQLAAIWGDEAVVQIERSDDIFEEKLLSLDSGKAEKTLGWRPRWRLDEAIQMTAAWYKAHRDGADMWSFTRAQLDAFESKRKAA